MDQKIIVALDFDNKEDTINLAQQLDPKYCRVKVGKELFTSVGPEIIHCLHNLGFEVFLDLKFHDIPNTVYKAIKATANLQVWMVNVHASGGREMLMAAKRAVNESQHKPLLIAVTILTSMDEPGYNEIGYTKSLSKQVLALAILAHQCGLNGVVCSAHEAREIKIATSDLFLAVTPGIRLNSSVNDDQKRIMTPKRALDNGADYLVIGRPITAANHPEKVIQQICQEIYF